MFVYIFFLLWSLYLTIVVTAHAWLNTTMYSLNYYLIFFFSYCYHSNFLHLRTSIFCRCLQNFFCFDLCECFNVLFFFFDNYISFNICAFNISAVCECGIVGDHIETLSTPELTWMIIFFGKKLNLYFTPTTDVNCITTNQVLSIPFSLEFAISNSKWTIIQRI